MDSKIDYICTFIKKKVAIKEDFPTQLSFKIAKGQKCISIPQIS